MYNTHNKYWKNNRGFTLIEVLMGVFVLALSALMLSALFPIAQTARIKGVYTTYAVSLAEQRVEELRSAGYASVQVSNTNVPVSDLPNGEETITITQYAAGIKKIEISIVWEGFRKVGGSVTLATFISDHS